jgi:predicted phage-related endonuclease
VAVLFGNAELRVYQIPRDPELEALLLGHAVRFWEDHVLKDIPPPAKCEADYQHVFAQGSPRAIEASPEIARLIRELLRVQEQIEQQEQQVSQMKQRIMGIMEDAEILNFDGKVLATWKAPKPSIRLDAKRLTEEHPEWVLPYQVPLPYLIQCAWYLLLTQVPHCDVAVLFGNAELRVYQIPRDPELEILLLDHAIRFWEDHVLKDIPPPAKCEADYQHVFAQGSPRTIEASPEIAKLTQELLRVQEHIEHQEQEVSQMKQRIMGVMEDAELLNFDGMVLATWKAPKPSVRLDAKRLTEEHPEWVLPYQVPVQSNRRLLIKTNF